MAKTLLLADDSVVIQKLVGLSFANEAVELVTTDNGEDAITRAREVRPDLVLADVVMPGRSGYEVCEAIKQDPELAHIPVLLLTGTFEAFDEERAAAAGSNGHITKPFEAQVLVERVNELLARAPAAATSTPDKQTAPMPAVSDEPYEFFDEQEAAGSSDRPATFAASNASHEFVSAGDAFSFDSDEPSLTPAAPLSSESEPGGDRTVAMMPGEVPIGADLAPDDATILTDLSAASEAAAEDPAATMLVDDPFGDGQPDLSFNEDELGVGPASLEFDVVDEATSSGDTLLADDLFGESDRELTPLADSEPEVQVEGRELEGYEAPLIDSTSDAGVAAIDADEEPIDAEPLIEVSPAEPDLVEGEPLSTGGDVDEAEAKHDAFAPTPATIESPAVATAGASPTPSMPDLSPVLRERLHESLEKIAWEAFADLSDTIVKQALERVERIAWEVIPQMAEALIQEEIRRMKGDGEND